MYMHGCVYTCMMTYMNKSLNHNSLTANSCKHTQAYIIIDVMNEVTQCAGPVLTNNNARSHQLCQGDQEWAYAY